MRSTIAAFVFLTPSQMIPSEMKTAAAPSSHHNPTPTPSTPTIEATVVCQSALAMSASAYKSLLCSTGASFALAGP